MHILIVDDEPDQRGALARLLRHEGYQVIEAGSGEEAIALVEQQHVDLVLSDLHMPGIDGIGVVQAAHLHDPDLVCIILTGRGNLESAIDSLRHDVFDYLLKTTAPHEIIERVAVAARHRSQLQRRKEMLQALSMALLELGPPDSAGSQLDTAINSGVKAGGAAANKLRFGVFEIDMLRHEVVVEGRHVALTPAELRVLTCLAQHAGEMLSYVDLVRFVHGLELTGEEATALIKPHIYHLRRKLELDPTHPCYLLNVRGAGYLLKPDAAQADAVSA